MHQGQVMEVINEGINVLSDRRQRVLSALIEEYITYALPVGSRTLVERYQLGVSSATVRNELSLLEDAGYIQQPHTSAGRIPTDIGYRAFVDELLTSEAPIGAVEYEPLIEDLRRYASEMDALLEQTSLTLARLTDCLSIVLSPSIISLRIKHISLIALTDYQIMTIIITEDGQVFNHGMELSEPLDMETLSTTEIAFNQFFSGKAFDELKTGSTEDAIGALRSPFAQIVLKKLALLLQDTRPGRSHRLGLSSLLRKPEFSQARMLLPIMQILEDETVLLHILENDHYDSGTIVKIGRENNSEELAGVSVVTSKYGRGDSAGIVAIIGPTRMDYSRAIQAVRSAQQVLQDT